MLVCPRPDKRDRTAPVYAIIFWLLSWMNRFVVLSQGEIILKEHRRSNIQGSFISKGDRCMTDHRRQARSSRRWKIGRIALIAWTIVVTSAFLEFSALATPPSGVHVEGLALSDFGKLDISPSNSTGNWHLQAKTNQETDVAVFRVVLDAGSHFGWHSHPGASFVHVTNGTVTEYDGTDCAVTTYHAGQAFFEPANHVHDVRSSAGAEIIATQIMPHGAQPVIDQPAPTNCP